MTEKKPKNLVGFVIVDQILLCLKFPFNDVKFNWRVIGSSSHECCVTEMKCHDCPLTGYSVHITENEITVWYFKNSLVIE